MYNVSYISFALVIVFRKIFYCSTDSSTCFKCCKYRAHIVCIHDAALDFALEKAQHVCESLTDNVS